MSCSLQVQAVLESSGTKRSQFVIMERLCSIALLLAVDLGIMSGSDADTIFDSDVFRSTPSSPKHAELRLRSLPSAIEVVKILNSVCQGSNKPDQAAKGVSSALSVVLHLLELECSSGQPKPDPDFESKGGHAGGARSVIFRLKEACKDKGGKP